MVFIYFILSQVTMVNEIIFTTTLYSILKHDLRETNYKLMMLITEKHQI